MRTPQETGTGGGLTHIRAQKYASPHVDADSGNYTSVPELHITLTLIPKVTLDFGRCPMLSTLRNLADASVLGTD